MIGFLSGLVKAAYPDVIIDCHGVGYLVKAGTLVRARLQSQIGQPVELAIYTHVREDALDLYGFQDWSDRELFVTLLDVSGVGPRTALSIVDQGRQAVVEAVQNANVAFFAAVPRVGKKMAQKIIIELKSKLGSLKELSLEQPSQEQSDVVAALKGLGFGDLEIEQAMGEISVSELGVSASVKAALKKLARNA